MNREELLVTLGSVTPGLSKEAGDEERASFHFRDGELWTFNNVICCITKCDIGVNASFRAVPLLKLLNRMDDEEVEFTGKSRIQIQGSDSKRKIELLPIECRGVPEIHIPKKWKPVPDEFSEAMDIVSSCASSKDDGTSRPICRCVHITKEFVEACDNFQAARYSLNIKGLTEPVLITKEAAEALSKIGATRWGIDGSWMFFKNSDGLILASRISDVEYLKLDSLFEIKRPSKLGIPPSLKKSVDCAEVFSLENKEDNQLLVEVTPSKYQISASGVIGRFKEEIDFPNPKLKESVKFSIPPHVLRKVVEDTHDHALIGQGKIMIRTTNWSYITTLGVPM